MAYDVIVVGARCAGAPTAMLLARRGYRVLVVDRMALPGDVRLSTHLVWQPGVEALAGWGLLEKVKASGCPPLSRISLDFGPVTLQGQPPFGAVADAYAPRRYVLDAVLLEGAIDAGAEVRDRCTLEDLIWEGDRVKGVALRADRSSFNETASIVVGADGIQSRVARLVGAPEYNTQRPLEGTYFSYWSDVPIDGIDVHIREGRACYAWSTNDDLSLVGANWVSADYGAVRGNVDEHFFSVIDAVTPDLGERLRNGTRVDHWIGTTVGGYYRKPFGPGWALVGDAGYNKDPSTAQGITDAFRDAQLLADAIDQGLSGRRPMTEALGAYEAARNEASGALYALTNQLAALEAPDPQMQQLLGALAGNTEQTNHFLGVLAGTVRVEAFFAPDNLAEIFSTADAAGG